jgi:hypothetical protein
VDGQTVKQATSLLREKVKFKIKKKITSSGAVELQS